ncbi:hypothetical protein M0R45_020558 [Rubus argutus]|uniref:Uncharacterized protein n=1 Tax=Rubus argutus TaxID=59490 RepID=A0AAW1XB38_RUBAR
MDYNHYIIDCWRNCFHHCIRWDESMGVPGALMVRNHHHSQFYLKTITLEDVPGHGRVHFVCNSWVYPAHRYNYDRIFFSNKPYLPSQTPELLRPYREEELKKGRDYERKILGGSQDYPYPRRGRTGRKPNKRDPNTESRLFLLRLDIYVPRDERFGHVKFSDFLAYALKSLAQILIPELKSLCDKTINEFDTFQDVLDLYEGGIKLPNGPTLKKTGSCPLGAS